MSVFHRIISTTGEITRNSARERMEREKRDLQRADDAQDLRERNALHDIDEANRRLHQTNALLRRENEMLSRRAIELEQQASAELRLMADRSEAWRRTAHHLRTTWGAQLPDVASGVDAVCDIVDAKAMEIETDDAWHRQRDAYVSERLASADPQTSS